MCAAREWGSNAFSTASHHRRRLFLTNCTQGELMIIDRSHNIYKLPCGDVSPSGFVASTLPLEREVNDKIK